MKKKNEETFKQSYESDGKMSKAKKSKDDIQRMKEAEFFNITPESE